MHMYIISKYKVNNITTLLCISNFLIKVLFKNLFIKPNIETN